ncbi:MAG TPA: hypothetical protein VN641_05935 [Urbifossiella sp.]|nr:hypothetical protein [Urbifossiella sp.]
MATALADTFSTRPDHRQRLWQVPLFLVGVAAFVGTYQGWLPLASRDPSSAFRRDLAELHRVLGKQSPDLNSIKAHLEQVAGEVKEFPEQAAAAHFALGTGYMRLAELSADPAESLNYWMLTKQHFDEVRPDQLADPADGARLRFRAAKARAATPWSKAAQAELDATRRILLTPPYGEESGEGHRLAAELGLRLVPPDLTQAKTSFTAYIADSGIATPPASIARAKLRLSEVYRQLGNVEEAKKWLAQIGTDAPTDVLRITKAQLARIRMDEGDFPGARREWEVLLALPGLPNDLKRSATYHVGVCLLSNKPPDPVGATRRFEEAVQTEGVERAAAAVRLADLRLHEDSAARRKDAAGLLALAVKGITGPGEYPKNALIPIHDVQAEFEAAIQALTAEGAFEEAAAVAEAYQSVAAAGRNKEKRAEVFTAWGVALKKSKGDAAPKFMAAAAEYAALAALRSAETDKADLFRKAAELHRQAGDVHGAVAALEQIVKLPKLPDDVSGPFWIQFAEALLAVNRPDDALIAFQKAILTNSSAAIAARYRVARHMIESRDDKKIEFGIALMDQVAKLEKVATPAEQAMHERALVDVAHAYIQQAKFAEAEARLSKQINLYPIGDEAGLGKLLLGVCLLQRADPRAKPQAADPKKNRDDALRLFQEVVDGVKKRAEAKRSADRDLWLRTQASLRILQCYQQMSRPYDVLKDGEAMRREFAGTANELIVLSLMYHAFKLLDKPESVLGIHAQMREVFDKIKEKPGVFWQPVGEYSREYWEKTWFQPPDEPKKK